MLGNPVVYNAVLHDTLYLSIPIFKINNLVALQFLRLLFFYLNLLRSIGLSFTDEVPIFLLVPTSQMNRTDRHIYAITSVHVQKDL
jgi:hypothetical protein